MQIFVLLFQAVLNPLYHFVFIERNLVSQNRAQFSRVQFHRAFRHDVPEQKIRVRMPLDQRHDRGTDVAERDEINVILVKQRFRLGAVMLGILFFRNRIDPESAARHFGFHL